MIFGKKKRILIEFFDVETGEKLGFDEKRPKQIPLSFQHETIVEFGGKRWKLVSAEPFERKKYLKAGKISIGLQPEEKGEAVDVAARAETPAETLFRSPSRAEKRPEFAGKREGKDLLEMMEDEWQMVELVPASLSRVVSQEFGRIEAVIKTAATEQDGRTLYRRQHVRSLSAQGFQVKGWSPEKLREKAFPFSTKLPGLTFMGEAGIAKEAFAFRLPAGIVLYGLADGGKVRSLALRKPAAEHKLIARADLDRLLKFMEAENLVLVDWEKLSFVEPILTALTRYLGIPLEENEDERHARETPTAESMLPLPDLNPEVNTDTAEAETTSLPVSEPLEDLTIDLSLDHDTGSIQEEE